MGEKLTLQGLAALAKYVKFSKQIQKHYLYDRERDLKGLRASRGDSDLLCL